MAIHLIHPPQSFDSQFCKEDKRRMTLDDIYYNISEATFSALVCQADIRTKAELKKFQKKGYMVNLTADQFTQTFPLLPIDKIYYSPSLTQISLYFNSDSLAAVPILIPHLFLVPPTERKEKQEKYLEAIEKEEIKVAKGDYRGSLRMFTNAMCLEHLEMVVKRVDFQNLYSEFFRIYRKETFGFSVVSPEFMQHILEKKTDKDKEQTAAALRNLPDTITIFRGGNTFSVPYDRAFSWTTDINTASFFAARQGNGPGYIVRADIGKNEVIEYFPNHSEQEIIVNPTSRSFQIQEVVEVKGLAYLDKMLPIVTPEFHRYREELYSLNFAQKSAVHGVEHEARVLLHCLLIAYELNLPQEDIDSLCTAALYHDVRRDNDGVDEEHGAMGKDHYEESVQNPDPVVSFLCEFHCLPDEVGMKRARERMEIGERGARLLHVFKDADALDRVRFKIQDVDLNQMRLEISKTMVLVARLVFQNLKI